MYITLLSASYSFYYYYSPDLLAIDYGCEFLRKEEEKESIYLIF